MTTQHTTETVATVTQLPLRTEPSAAAKRDAAASKRRGEQPVKPATPPAGKTTAKERAAAKMAAARAAKAEPKPADVPDAAQAANLSVLDGVTATPDKPAATRVPAPKPK